MGSAQVKNPPTNSARFKCAVGGEIELMVAPADFPTFNVPERVRPTSKFKETVVAGGIIVWNEASDPV